MATDTDTIPAVAKAKRSLVEYPDSDGKPMSDNTLQRDTIAYVVQALRCWFLARLDVFVAGDLLWYYEVGNPKARVAPDGLVAFGRPPGYRGSYMQWVEDGVCPQVVFEVLSPKNTAAEMQHKYALYARLGCLEYLPEVTGSRSSRMRWADAARCSGLCCRSTTRCSVSSIRRAAS